jgi:hypothetical protein
MVSRDKAEASQARGAARAPKQCRDRRVEQETERKQFRYRFSPWGNLEVNGGDVHSERRTRDLMAEGGYRWRNSVRTGSMQLVATCTVVDAVQPRRRIRLAPLAGPTSIGPSAGRVFATPGLPVRIDPGKRLR